MIHQRWLIPCLMCSCAPGHTCYLCYEITIFVYGPWLIPAYAAMLEVLVTVHIIYHGCTLCPGDVFLFWMGLVTLAYIYNAVAIPLRASFGDVVQPLPGLYAWLVFDYLFDLLYILDIVLVQVHLSYRHNGVLEVRSHDRRVRSHDQSHDQSPDIHLPAVKFETAESQVLHALVVLGEYIGLVFPIFYSLVRVDNNT